MFVLGIVLFHTVPPLLTGREKVVQEKEARLRLLEKG